MKPPYEEGTWFAVPLRDRRSYGVGVVARAFEGGVLLCYFFGPRRNTVPSLDEVANLLPSDAIRVLQVGDLGILEGQWQIVGSSPEWERSEWPIPPFARYELLTDRVWKVSYSDTNPNQVVQEEQIDPKDVSFGRDALYGSEAAEIELTEALTE